jgi:uncharacterized membrane protein
MTQNTPIKQRIWEIDALRGLAVVAMIFFHFMWDLWFLGLTAQDITSNSWQAFARSIGGTFTFLLGVSLVLSDANLRTKGIDSFRATLKRGLMIFAFGLAISVGTYFFVGDSFVRFGILHHAGVALILAYFFLRLTAWLIGLTSIAIIAIGKYFESIAGPSAWLIPFGLVPPGTNMVDYYPLLPWFGVALLGVAAGKLFYASGRRFAFPDLSSLTPIRWLQWLGRNSLVVYLAHQPILIGALMGARQLGWV